MSRESRRGHAGPLTGGCARGPSRIALLAFLCSILLAIGCGGDPAPEPKERPEHALLNVDPAVRFVGAEACRPCHLQQASTYAGTGMGRAFYPLTADVVVEDFTEDNLFVDQKTGLHYLMEGRDGRYFQRQYLLDSDGVEMAVDEYELQYIVGSNNHSRSYILLRDGKWFQAPICWYPGATRWDFCPGYEVENDHFNREVSLNCLQCHNGRMVPVDGERNEYQEPIPHGIGCERCHGPGELHVQRWKDSAETPTGEPDPTIAHPRRMPPNERLSVCFQCHLGDARATERVGRPGRDILDYRPGQPLGDYIVAFQYEHQTQVEFGLSSQADRMILSRCFTESGGKMECLTCHDPHVSSYHEDRPPDYFTQRCVGCHGEDACDAPEHHRAEIEPANDCVACHMRKAEADDQRFAVFTDHWIRERIDFDEADHREDHAIRPVDERHFDSLPVGERAFYLARAHSLMAMNVDGEPQRQMRQDAVDQFNRAIENGYDTVDAWFFLGKTYRQLGQGGPAKDAFMRAYRLDPDHHDAAFAFGQTSFAAGEPLTAIEVFEVMLVTDPDNPMALAELGRVYTVLGRLDEALEAYDRALVAEPWNASLHLNRGMLLAAGNRFDEAREAARAAVRLDSDGIPEWEFYEKLMRAVGEPELAAEARNHLEKLRSTELATN